MGTDSALPLWRLARVTDKPPGLLGAGGELPAATVRGVWSRNTVAGEELPAAAPEQVGSCRLPALRWGAAVWRICRHSFL